MENRGFIYKMQNKGNIRYFYFNLRWGVTVLRYEEINEEIKELLKKNEIIWDEHRGYVSNLHKDLYLKESEVKSQKYLIQYCDLVQYLKELGLIFFPFGKTIISFFRPMTKRCLSSMRPKSPV